MEYFSVIIPTMWYSNQLMQMIPVYQKCNLIAEIIIINNNKSLTPEYFLNKNNLQKLKMISPDANIFVNPAWNLGVSHASHTPILANDDIIVSELDALLHAVRASKYDLIGASVNSKTAHNPPRFFAAINKKTQGFPRRSFGCFMVCRNYKYIPEQMIIYSGDTFQFDQAQNPAIIIRNHIHTPISQTLRKRPDLKLLGKSDPHTYRQLKNSIHDDTKHNIIIRTSGRPNFFKICVNSIKPHAPNALLHITIDSPADLDYVKSVCEAAEMRYNYYLIKRDTVAQFCAKIPIQRKAFIFNHYFNIVKPFLNGYVQFIDDDDMLVQKPNTSFALNSFYLYLTNINNRFVPDAKHQKTITLNHISGLSVVCHSSQMPQWNPQRGGDFDFITALAAKYTPIWNNTVLSATITKGNNGQRNDLSI